MAIERALPELALGRLPTVREWVVRLGAGTRTVHMALERLVERGVLRKRRGAGYWRASEFPEETLETSSWADASRLAGLLAVELRGGRHPWSTPLPSIKEWARRWECHRHTAAKAIESLVSQGAVVRRGRSLYPRAPRGPRSGAPSVILCVGAAGTRGELRMDTEREIDFWKELGVESSRLGVALRRVPWDGGALRLDSAVVGVVASTWHLPEPEWFYAVLDRVRVPVCVWIQDPSTHRSPVRSHPRLRFHDQGYGESSGRLIAAHLLERGHRRIAFVSPWNGSIWSRNRLEGLREEAAVHGAVVDAFCLDGISEWDRLAPAWSDPAIWNAFPADLMARVVEGSSDSVREHAIRTLAWNRIRRDLEPLFAEALASPATAWVGANDECALLAQEWLAARSERRALAGFDDTAGALRADLTSFRFDSGAMVRSMLGQILSGSSGPGLTRHEGVVVPRG